MRRDEPERRSDAPRRGPERRVPLRTLFTSCALLCGLFLGIAYGAAAIDDALETRVSLLAAEGGFAALASAPKTRSEPISVALAGRRAPSRAALRRPAPESSRTQP
jgi:hypothetical protein